MIAMEASEVVMTNMGFAVLLRNDTDERVLPIFIGPFEAQAIVVRLNPMRNSERPMTHDLLRSVIETLGTTLLRVEIIDIRSGTFYAELVVQTENRMFRIDARPSDAIALALRCESPIAVAPHVLLAAGQVLERDPSGTTKRSAQADATESMPPSTTGQKNRLKIRLENAIRDERYEQAAKLRDAIARCRPDPTGI